MERHAVNKVVGKMVQIDLLDAGLPQTFIFFFFKVASVEQKKGKCNRMRHACLLLNVSTHLSTSLFLFNRGCQSIALWAKGVLFVYRLKPEWFLRFLLVGQNQENNNIL